MRSHLVDIDFSGDWRQHVPKSSVLRGVRSIGVLTLEGGRRAALMRAEGGRYVLWQEGVEIDLADRQEEIERFLQERRRGHRGGLGRGQGRKSRDGCSYTKATCLLLTREEVEQLVRLGDGDLSLGVRRIARKEKREESAAVGESKDKVRVKAYIDPETRAILCEEGKLIDGIRARLVVI